MNVREVKKGLKCCSQMPYDCKNCPFFDCDNIHSVECMETMHKSAYKKLVLME